MLICRCYRQALSAARLALLLLLLAGQLVTAQDAKYESSNINTIVWNPQPVFDQVAVAGSSSWANYTRSDGFLIVYRASDMSIAFPLTFASQDIHTGVHSATWSPNGYYLALALATDRIVVLNINDPAYPIGAQLGEFGVENIYAVLEVAWSPDGSWIASTYMVDSENTLVVWDARDHNYALVSSVPVAFSGTDLAWNPDSRSLAIDGPYIYQVSPEGILDNQPTWLGPMEALLDENPFLPNDQVVYGFGPSWNPSGTQLAFSDTFNNRILIYDVSTNTQLNEFRADGNTGNTTWSADGSKLAYAYRSLETDHIYYGVVDIASGAQVATYTTTVTTGVVSDLFSPEGDSIIFPIDPTRREDLLMDDVTALALTDNDMAGIAIAPVADDAVTEVEQPAR